MTSFKHSKIISEEFLMKVFFSIILKRKRTTKQNGLIKGCHILQNFDLWKFGPACLSLHISKGLRLSYWFIILNLVLRTCIYTYNCILSSIFYFINCRNIFYNHINVFLATNLCTPIHISIHTYVLIQLKFAA